MQQKKTESEWIEILQIWEESGLSRGEYCKEHQIRLSTFDYWKRKLKANRTSTSLVKIQPPLPFVSAPCSTYRMKVTTRDFAVEVASDITSEEILTMLRACRELL